MNKNIDKYLLLMKKEKFVEVVIKICKERNLPIPIINFNGCPNEENDELAHYHPDENKICCSERQLHMQNFDDIFDTASHEVTHISELNHDSGFIKEKILNDKAGWNAPPGIVIIDGNQPVSDSEKEKSKKTEKALQELQEEIEQKQEKEILRDYPLVPKSLIKDDEHIFTPAEIIKLSGEYYPVEDPGEPPENYKRNKKEDDRPT